MLETARLRLMPWQPEDWVLLRPLATNPDVVRYISNGEPWPDERIREWARRQVAHFAKFGFCFWKLIHKETGEMIGFCGLQPVELEGAPEIEIGWWLAPDMVGPRLCDGSSARGDARWIRARRTVDGSYQSRCERMWHPRASWKSWG